MASKWARKFDYVRERAANALWMIKQGDFKLILKSIYLEIHYRVEDLKEWIRLARLLDDAQVLGSNYCNRCKVTPPSPRPTVSVRYPSITPRADPGEVSRELNRILSSISVRDNHSI